MSAWRLLGRPECHLCEEFAAALAAAFPQIELESVCVDDDPEWRFDYGREIPVLLDPRGRPVCRTFFDEAAVAQHLLTMPRQADG